MYLGPGVSRECVKAKTDGVDCSLLKGGPAICEWDSAIMALCGMFAVSLDAEFK